MNRTVKSSINFDKTKVILANPGSGKTTTILNTMDKQRDVVIVITTREKQRYINAGVNPFHVFTYQFLKEYGQVEFMRNVNIYVDECFMIDSQIIYKLLFLDTNKVFVGDIKQNINRSS